MAKIALLVLTICLTYGFLNGAESTTADSAETSESSSETAEVQDKDKTDRMAYSHAMAGGNGLQSRPRPSPPLIVECQVCTDCPFVGENTPSKLCPYSLDPNKRGKCVTYAEKYRHMQRPWYIRGCASERGSCEDIRRAHQNHGEMVKLLFCNECEGERCNRNGAATFADCTIAFLVLIVTPLLSKFTLS